ncbi:DUF5956 family protein [Streptomyces sp. 8N114]|uniref:DUF5956 family protein n=1 Tax=Streptomyces sp. 8N114 TaxID=3457419 RepID=UPI003FD3AC46
MTISWAEFPVAEEPSERKGDVYRWRDGRQYIELTENGWGALLAWCAGPAHVVRCPDHTEKPPVVTTVTGPGGTVTRSESPRTAADQAEIDDEIDGYLADADVPPQPRGWRWFLALPSQCANARDFHGLVGSAFAGLPKDMRPREIRDVLSRLSHEVLGR